MIQSLSQREMVTGFAEILKHAIIFDKKFYSWLDKNSFKLLKDRNIKFLKEAIYKVVKLNYFS